MELESSSSDDKTLRKLCWCWRLIDVGPGRKASKAGTDRRSVRSSTMEFILKLLEVKSVRSWFGLKILKVSQIENPSSQI